MKHVFILNLAAGQGAASALRGEIEAVCSVAGLEYEIYETTAVGDAERSVRTCCEAIDSGPDTAPDGNADSSADADPAANREALIRFYACGGDGTLNEVVNGAFGYGFTEIGCIPTGTGNDFVRNFPEGNYLDLVDQIRGQARFCDLIRYEGVCDGEAVSRYCVNMCNIGFDCNVVDMTARMKQMPLISGSMAYLSSVAAMLVRKKGADLRVVYDDGFVHDGKLLLIAVANGCFCGGGIKGIPRAKADDGKIDVSLIKNVPRHTFVRLFPKYMQGTHLNEPALADVLRYSKERTLTISSNNDSMKVSIDGEIFTAETLKFTICPAAFRFVVPA